MPCADHQRRAAERRHKIRYVISVAALARLDRIHLAMFDAPSPRTVRELIYSLSEPMNRNDAESAIRRLRGSGMAVPVPSTSPRRWRLTLHGEREAEAKVARGLGY